MGLAPLFARRRLLWTLGVVLVVLFIVVEAMLLRSYGSTERTTGEFHRTTDAATALANVQRETLLLSQAVSRLRPGDDLEPIVVRRGLVDRQLSVVVASGVSRRELTVRVDTARRYLSR